MAKQKSSIVSGAFAPKERPSAEEARKAAEEATASESQMGRPRATHGYKQTSILADLSLMQRMKALAGGKGLFLYDVMNEAMQEYLDRHE